MWIIFDLFRRDTAMAGLLTSIVVVFLACHCPKVAVNLYEVLQVIINLHPLNCIKAWGISALCYKPKKRCESVKFSGRGWSRDGVERRPLLETIYRVEEYFISRPLPLKKIPYRKKIYIRT